MATKIWVEKDGKWVIHGEASSYEGALRIAMDLVRDGKRAFVENKARRTSVHAA